MSDHQITNEEFLSLPKDKQRVEIARDVLRHLVTHKLVATNGSWLRNPAIDMTKYDLNTQVKSVLEPLERCQVCALGGLFASAVLRANATTVEDYIPLYAKEDKALYIPDNSYYILADFTTISAYLSRFFDQDQLKDIESAFERGEGGVAEDLLAQYYAPDVDDPEDRMRLIMNNIIDNNGTFIHGVTEAPNDYAELFEKYDINPDNWDPEAQDTIAENLEEHGQAYADYLDWLGDPDDFEDHYQGWWSSEEAFAENLLDDLGELDHIPRHLRSYFDMEAYARDLFISDYHMTSNGYVFSNY